MRQPPLPGPTIRLAPVALLPLVLLSATACASANGVGTFGCMACDEARAWGIAPIALDRVLNADLSPTYVAPMDHGVECADLTVGPIKERRFGFSLAKLHVVQDRGAGSAWGGVAVTVLLQGSHGRNLFRSQSLNTFRTNATCNIDLPAGPDVPFARVTVHQPVTDFGHTNELQEQYLVDLRSGAPRIVARAECSRKVSTCQGGESRWRTRWAAECRWDAERQDFLCEAASSYPAGYALRTESLWYFLFSNRRLRPRSSDEETENALLDFAAPKAGTSPPVGLTKAMGRLGLVTMLARLPPTGASGAVSLLAAPASACFFAVEERKLGERRLGKACAFRPSTGDWFFRGKDPWIRVDNDREDEARLNVKSSFVTRSLWRDGEGQEVLEFVETWHSSPPTHTVGWIGVSSLPDRFLVDQIEVASDTPSGGTCRTIQFPGFAEAYSVDAGAGRFSAELRIAPAYEVDSETGVVDVLDDECPSTRRVGWDREKGFVRESEEPDCSQRSRVVRARVRPDGAILPEPTPTRQPSIHRPHP